MVEIEANSQREQMLEALKTVLEGIPGVNRVDRQAIKAGMLADPELPAILIDETNTRYVWESRHQGRQCRNENRLILDLQAVCTRSTENPHGNVSTTREAFVWVVLDCLANNAALKCQLPGENEVTPHCKDAFNEAEVRYLETEFPYARALIVLEVLHYDVFDDRTPVAWQRLILEASAQPFTAVPGAQPEDDIHTTTITPTEGADFTSFEEA